MERLIIIIFFLVSSLSFGQITLEPNQIDKINQDYFLLTKYKKLNELNIKEIQEKDKVIKNLDLNINQLNKDLNQQIKKTEIQKKQKTTFIIISTILGGIITIKELKK